MELHIDKMELLDGITTVSKAVNAKGTLPILGCILLEAETDGVQLTGNNLEMCIKTAPIAASILAPGKIALDAKLFTDIVKKLPGSEINISVDSENLTLIRSGRTKFKIDNANPEEFTPMPEIRRDNKITLPGAALRDMIRQTLFAVAKTVGSRVAMTGQLFKFDGGTLHIVGCDGFRIAHRFCATEAKNEVTLLIPGSTIAEIAKILPGHADAEVSVYHTDKHAIFETDTCTAVLRLLEGEYLNYESSLQCESKTACKVNRIDFLHSLERARLIATESGRTPVKFEIGEDTITFTAATSKGDVYDQITAEISGNKLTIAFNPLYFLEALKAIEDKEIELNFGTALQPCIIRSVEKGEYEYLILPLRLQK